MSEPHKVLVIDDDALIVRLLSHALSAEGYDVLTAADGEQGLRCIEEFGPELVFVDAMMPRKDGYQVCEEVCANTKLDPRPYIIMLTAGGQEADRHRAEAAGVDEFMTKPFSPSQLRLRAKEILDA